MNELIPVFETSLFDTPLTDMGIDFLELGIDSILQDGLLKDVPIVGTIVNLGKFGQNVHDRNLLRQTLIFINEFHNNQVSEEKIIDYRTKLQNPIFLEAELGRVMILLNKNVDTIKSIYEAKFYSAYVDKQISWYEFCELCDITDRLFVSDLDCLKDAYLNNGISVQDEVSYKHDRLISVGLLINETRLSGSVVFIDLDSPEQQNIMDLTPIGRKFCDIAFTHAVS